MHTARIFACLCLIQLALALPGVWWSGYLDTPIGLILVMPYFAPYLAHAAGLPGVLENNGLCGWGWCAPSPLGWLLIVATWATVYWLIAAAIGWLLRKPDSDRAGD